MRIVALIAVVGAIGAAGFTADDESSSLSASLIEEGAGEGLGAPQPTQTQLDGDVTQWLKDTKEGTLGGGEFPQFPGPRYGLPGYKESHNWEGGNDVDYMSPLIFDWKAYKDAYKMASSTTEAEAKTDWLAKLKEKKYPNCPMGRLHDRPPDGFSLKTYYDANVDKLKPSLGETPKCIDLAKQFLSAGLFEGLPTAPQQICKTCPDADGTPPPSSWVLCKWRSWRKMAGYRRRYRLKTYNRDIYEWDRMRSKDTTAMNSFAMKPSYSVTFWYRPKKGFIGEIFNFGEANQWYSRYYVNKVGNTAFWTPGVEQYPHGDGVKLKFRVSTAGDRNWVCDPTSTSMSSSTKVGGVLPFDKWTYVALSVSNADGKVTAKVFYDNQGSQVQQNSGGESSGVASLVETCEVEDQPLVPGGLRNGGYRVWSYYPGRRRRRRIHNNGGSLAGLTYWNQAMSVARVSSMYKYEENGVDAWSTKDAQGNNNGAC